MFVEMKGDIGNEQRSKVVEGVRLQEWTLVAKKSTIIPGDEGS